MHVLIVEDVLTGHHSGYLARIASRYLTSGHIVTITVRKEFATHQSIVELEQHFSGALRVVSFTAMGSSRGLLRSFGKIGREIAFRNLVADTVRRIHAINPVDYVFLPYLDYCLYAVALLGSPFGSVSWGGICMRPSFHYQSLGVIAPRPNLGKVKRALFLKLLRSPSLKHLYTIDSLLFDYINVNYPRVSSRLEYAPDPAELTGSHTWKSARQTLGISDESVVILVYGTIDERKGIDTLIEALNHADSPKSIYLLVAGRQSPELRQLLSSFRNASTTEAEIRCKTIDAFIDSATEQQLFAAADAIWMGYRAHYNMSGVLMLSVAAKKPVIATEAGLIGWFTNKWQIGCTFREGDSDAVHRILKIICDKSVREEFAGKFLNLNLDHSWAAFLRAVVK